MKINFKLQNGHVLSHISGKIFLCIFILLLLNNSSLFAQCTAPTNTLVQPTSCIVPNGQITVSSPTPVANYMFSKDDGLTFQASNIFTGLAGGSYNMRTKEIATSCISTRTIAILINPAVTTPTGTVVANANCVGTPTGQITVNAPTPLTNFTFSIDGGATFQASNVFTNLAAGSYSIIAKNIATGCTSAIYTALVPNTFVAVATPVSTNVNPTSCSTPNGSITVTTPTPLANFEFSIDNGVTFQASAVFTGLAPVSYQVVAKSIATGCESATPLVVTLTKPVIATPTSTIVQNSVCIGTPNGQITVTGYTPSTDYTYSLNGGAFQASNIFTGLGAGTYSLVAKSNLTGCSSASGTATVSNSPTAIATPTTTLVQPTSCSTPNGSITVTAPTPLASYEFSIDNGLTYQASNIFSGLPTGTYSVKARNLATGCASPSGTATLTNTSTVAATATSNTSCLAPNGLITITGPLPLANYTFSIDGGVTYQASTSFPNLAGGSYNVIAKANASGCTSTVLLSTVNNTPLVIPTPTRTVVQLTSCTVDNGSITITAPTPLANYLFSIDNGVTYQATTSYTNLAAGVYEVVAKNIAIGCESPASVVTLTTPAKVTPTNTTTANSVCSGTPNGQITVNSPITPLTDYLYSIDNGVTYQASNVFTNVSFGTHLVLVKTIASGCISNSSNGYVTNTFALPTTPTTTIVNNTSCITPTGSITANAPLPTANYTWSIDNGATFQASNVFNGLQAGSYQVMARSIATGCVSSPIANTVTDVAITAPTSTNVANTSCSLANGSITLTGPTPLADFTFSIDNGVTFQASNVFSGLNAQTYKVIAKNTVTGCSSPIFSTTITDAFAGFSATATATPITDCSTYNGAINFTAPTPLANYTFSIDNGATYQASSSFTNLAPGTYNARAKSIATNCVSASIALSIILPVVTTPTTSILNTSCLSNNGAIIVNSPTPLGNYQFSNNGGATYQASNTFAGLGAGTYNIVAKLSSSNCTSPAQVSTIAILPITAPTVTNVSPTICSTPNGSITVTAPTPSSSYTFSKDGGVTFQASNLFSGLVGGTYNVVVKSISTSCISAANVATLTASVQATPTVTAVSSTSCLSPNGSITVNAPSPLANYMFSKDGGITFQASNVFSNLPAATYSDLVIKNIVTGCQSVEFSSVIANGLVIPSASAVSTNPSNCIAPNGTITFNGPSPFANYVFSIDNGVTYQASNIFNNVAVGTYNLKVKTNATSCVSTNAVTINLIPSVGTIPTRTFVQPTTCNGNGKIIFEVAAPASINDFEYSIDNGVTYQASNIFNNLVGNVYDLKARNTNTNCVFVLTDVTLTDPIINISSTATGNSNCTGLPNGIISITSFNSANYVYSLNNGAYQANNVFTGLVADTYIISVKNLVTGCIATGTKRLLNDLDIPGLTGTTIAPSSSCISPNGSINFLPNQANQNLFSLDEGLTYQASPTFNGLAADSYNGFIKSTGSGCISERITIVVPASVTTPNLTVTKVNNSNCTTANGSITIAGGVTPLSDYTFSINNGLTYQASPIFNGLVADTYSVVAKNNVTGCLSAVLSAVITDVTTLPAPTNSFTESNSCATGNGTITFSTPTTGFSFSVNNGVTFQSSALFTGLGAGTYNLIAKSNTTGCITPVKQQVLGTQQPIKPTAIFVLPTACGGTDGSLTFNAPLPLSSYAYSIDGLAYQNSPVFTGLANGLYSITVKNIASGCISAINVIDMNCSAAPAITKNVYKSGSNIIATAASVNDVLDYVIEIKGGAVTTTPTLTDVMSTNQTYIANSVKGGNWTYTGGTSAWFGSAGTGTAKANYGGNLAPIVGGGFVPAYSNNKFFATNSAAPLAEVYDVVFGGAITAGITVVYFKTSDCEEKLLAKPTQTGQQMQCWNLTTNTNCNGDITALTPVNYSNPVRYQIVPETVVNNRYYLIDVSNGTNGTIAGDAQVNCIDLNPAGNPFYCAGYPKAIPKINGIRLNSTVGQMQNYDAVNDRLYFSFQDGNDVTATSWVCYLTVGTGVISVSKPYLPVSTSTINQLQHSTIFLANNKILIERLLGLDCIDVSLFPNLKDCNPANAPGVFTIYAPNPLMSNTTNPAPLLNSSGGIIGFCGRTQCFSLSGVPVPFPAGYERPTQSSYDNYLIDGTKVISHDIGTVNCYDFATNTSCGTASDNIGPYNQAHGIVWRVRGKCFSAIVNGSSSVTHWGIEPTGLVHNSALCSQNTVCADFQNTIPDPATRFCGPQANNIIYDKVNIKNLPAGGTGGTVQILCGATVVATYPFSAGAASFTKDISGIAYATCKTPTVKVIFNSLNGITASAVESEITYTNNGRFPEVCYSAKLTDCAVATNAVSLGGGAPNLTANTSITTASGVAPTLSGTTLSNTCPATTVNLNSLVTGTAPSGTILRWHTVSTNPTVADFVATPSLLATAGTYYAYYFDATSNCYSPASVGVTVTINSCTTCTAGTTAPTLSATTKSNVCPATTADISSLVSSTCPSGSSLEWHNVSTGFSASTIVTATSLGAGTYYPVCHDVTNTCYSPAPATGVTVSITACTQPPVAVADNFSTPVNTPIMLNLLLNDIPSVNGLSILQYNIDGILRNSTSYSTYTKVNNGYLLINNTDHNVQFIPETNFTGVTTFKYNAYDNNGVISNEVLVTITVNAISPIITLTDNQTASSTTPVITTNTLSPITGTAQTGSVITTKDGSNTICTSGIVLPNSFTSISLGNGSTLDRPTNGGSYDENSYFEIIGQTGTKKRIKFQFMPAYIFDAIMLANTNANTYINYFTQNGTPEAQFSGNLISNIDVVNFEFDYETAGNPGLVGIYTPAGLGTFSHLVSPTATVGTKFYGADFYPQQAGFNVYKIIPSPEGTFSCVPNTPFASGLHDFTAVQVNPSNTTSTSNIAKLLISVCNAGTTAPTLSATTKSNVCPATTADISSLVSSTCPVGSSLEWHNVSTGFSASNLVTASSVGAGTYYPVCHDVTNTCYSPAPATGVTVTITTCTTCNATVAPTLSATTATNICPSTIAFLNLITASNLPSGTTLTWHAGTPATAANQISPGVLGFAATYYAAFKGLNGASICFGPTTPVTVTETVCTPLTITQPPVITKPVSTPVTGTAPTDLVPTGGTGAITYTNGSTDPLCVAPVGANPLPATSNLTVSSAGAYSYTTPAIAGTYYFCVKVCDSTTPTPVCSIATYKVIVTAPNCIIGTTMPSFKN
jgi:Bacterial Ig domain